MLPYVSDVHGYLPNPKVSQACEFTDLDQGTNHELISKYQVHPFGRAGTIHSLVWVYFILCIFIIEHNFITNFAVLVYSYLNFADVIFINLYLI